MFAVTLAAAIWLAGSCLAQGPLTQYGRKPAADKGPRAIALIQLPSKGKGRLTPIAIMMDGKFYDAGSYKAAPVPMALDFGIIYEGFRSGVSQGVFTITQPGQINHTWIAEGTWLPAGAPDPTKHKKYSAPVLADDDKDGPPVLHRRSEKTDSDSSTKSDSGSKDAQKSNDNDKDSGAQKNDTQKNKDNDKDKDKDQQKTGNPAASPATAPPANPPSSADNSKAPPQSDAAKSPASTETAKSPTTDEPIADPNRPRLRRGAPESTGRRDVYTAFDALPDLSPGAIAAQPDAKGAASAAASPQIVVIPAISDAGGPDPRPYTYDLKPAEEAIYRNKMLELAATQFHPQTTAGTKEGAIAPKKSSAAGSRAKSSTKTSKLSSPQPLFDEVRLRIFDLSNSNEPVLVLSAKTVPPAASTTGSTGSIVEPKEITLIARTNLEGEIQKLFFSQTDSRHLDVTPRMELIDAVDADGDGRGELLFRRIFDEGSAYGIYRVTADGLWTLFEGTP
jgi:hypothetical protein